VFPRCIFFRSLFVVAEDGAVFVPLFWRPDVEAGLQHGGGTREVQGEEALPPFARRDTPPPRRQSFFLDFEISSGRRPQHITTSGTAQAAPAPAATTTAAGFTRAGVGGRAARAAEEEEEQQQRPQQQPCPPPPPPPPVGSTPAAAAQRRVEDDLMDFLEDAYSARVVVTLNTAMDIVRSLSPEEQAMLLGVLWSLDRRE
jgi:hypothetical protein